MKRTKRLSSIVISFMLVVSMILPSFSVITYAASSPTLSIDSKTVNQGEEFTVTVKVQNAANSVYNGNFTLQYDNSKLEAVSYTYGSIFDDHTKNCNLNYKSTGNQIRFTFSGAYPLNSDGTLVTITFKAKENVSGTAALQFTAYKMYDENGYSIDTIISDGLVTVSAGFSDTTSALEFELNEDGISYSVIERIDYNCKDIIIPSEYKGLPVTKIKANAFLGTNIVSIKIPKSIESIGRMSFNNCHYLESVIIESGVTTIEPYAFMHCWSLRGISIPNSATTIGEYAFYDCTNLTNVEIGNNVIEIGDCAFGGCTSLTSFTISSENKKFSSQDGVLFNKDKTEIIQYLYGNGRISYSIPDSVTTIGQHAFRDCTGLTNVIIPDSVICIEYYAFENCTNLISITIPNSVIDIDYSALEGCSNLTVYGYKDSAADKCATYNNIPFVALDAVELSSISIATQPSKKTYYIGDSLNTSGLQLELTYSDGSTETVSSGYIVSGFSSETAGTKTVTVNYEGLTTTFNVTVKTPTISISSTSKTLTVGDTATLTVTTTPSGQSVSWTSSNTNVVSVSNGVVTAKASGTAVITAKLTYNGKTYSSTCNITVNSTQKTLSSISISSNPTKTTYEIGESLNTSGLKLKLTYSDGSTEIISSGFTTSGFSSATAGTKTVTVKYGGFTTTFTVKVNSASVTPNPTDYEVTVTLESPSKLIVGKEFTLNVYMEGSYDGYSFEIPKYSAFTYKSSVAANSNVKVDEKSDKLIVSTMPGLELTDSPKTLIVSVTYTVNQNAAVSNMNLNVENAKITNELGDIITSVFISEKSVEIVKRIPGDINGDDVFDYTDVAKLYAYFRGKTTIDDGINIDFNNDGTFDYTDVAKLYAIFRGKSTF